MARPSKRESRRRELTAAFARVLAEHGFAGATIAAVAAEAGVAPGLIHHYFTGKDDLLESLLAALLDRFRARTRGLEATSDSLEAYLIAAVGLEAGADIVAARCWVGVFAEAVRDPNLFARVRRLVDSEISAIQRRSGDRFSAADAGAVLAFVLGALVLGAFAPRKTAGFAAPAALKLVAALDPTRRAPQGAHRT